MKKIVILGFGNIGQALVPLLKEHFPGWALLVIEREITSDRESIARELGVRLVALGIVKDNYRNILSPLLEPGDFLLNLATSISSHDLIVLAQSRGAFYIDTCLDPWEYSHSDHGINTSNYDLREQILGLRTTSEGRPTAITADGANPGFVSILVKQGLVEMAAAHGVAHAALAGRNDWARLARDLDVRVIQISERDTQVGSTPRAEGEFVNTWSIDGFVTECLQPAELGWGTHETDLPRDGRTHDYGCEAAIYIDRPSFTVKVKSWSPNYLDFEGFLITHNEAISLADFLTYREDGRVLYRPTSYYAYHPCDEAVESLSLLRNVTASEIRSTRVLKDEILSGIDELGVFLLSGTYPSLWLGSNLSIGKARKQAPYNNATSLQVVSSVAAAMAWALENPLRGVLEAEDLDHEFIYAFTERYWSPMVRQYITWRPSAESHDLRFADFLVK
jgi:homospermidine synthase